MQTPAKIEKITGPESYLKATSEGLRVVKFSSKKCPPCRKISPIFENLSQKYPNFLFLEVDCESEIGHEVAATYGVKTLPTIFVYVGGTRVATYHIDVAKLAACLDLIDSGKK